MANAIFSQITTFKTLVTRKILYMVLKCKLSFGVLKVWSYT